MTTAPPETVRLRPVTPGDLDTLFAYQSDAEACAMAAVVARTRAAFDEVWSKSWADPRVAARGIEADGVLVGSIAVFQPPDGLDSVGYWIGREHWGRGIATRALGLLVREVTRRPLHARAARANAASVKVLQRCGFRVVRYEDSPATERYLACEEAVLVLDGQ